MGITRLKTTFESRDELARFVMAQSPWVTTADPSPFVGGRRAALARLDAIKPRRYGRTRNHLDGDVTRLSPYIRHGVLSLRTVYLRALERVTNPERCEKFIQELAWRDYWQRVYAAHPEWIWNSIEPYKTGWSEAEYSATMPADVSVGDTPSACINAFIHMLHDTGYLHNHARMYLASYIVHWRRVQWQAGAAWMMSLLLDGDPASNNLSWQWVASTFSRRPYIFNLENVRRYTGNSIDTRSETNGELDASYAELSSRLFPHRR